MDNFEIIQRHMLDHNRDPHKNTALFEDRLRRVAGFDSYIVDVAVKKLSTADYLPKPAQLVYECMMASPKNQVGTVDCDICGSMGLVIGVVYLKDGSTMDIVSYDHQARKGGTYTTRVLGRCRCENGLAYQLVKSNAMGKIVEPDQFLVDAAAKNGWTVSFEAQMAAQFFRDKARGFKRKSSLDCPLAQLINKIIEEGEASEES